MLRGSFKLLNISSLLKDHAAAYSNNDVYHRDQSEDHDRLCTGALMVKAEIHAVVEDICRQDLRVGDELLYEHIEKHLDQVQDSQRNDQGSYDTAHRAVEERGEEEEDRGECYCT